MQPLRVAAQTLPTGWTAADIGVPALAGSTSASNGVFTMRGAGVDVWGTSDQFQYVYRQVTGDGDIVARVSSVQYAHAWAKAGVMIRATAHAAAAHGFALVTPGNVVVLHRRPSTGSVSISTGSATGTAPIWLKLERRGSTLNAYRSAAGSTWTLISSQTVTLPTSYLIGLAVTSHSAATLATAIFDNVTVRAATGAPTPQPPSVALTAPTAGATFTAPASVALAATAADTDGTVARVDFYAGSTLLGSDTSAPYTYTWTNAPAGTHAITAIARDSSGLSATSAARSITVSPATIPVGQLPTGWTASDIGVPALAGSTSASNGVFTMRGAGVDIWGTSDQFQYVYRQVTGDGDIVARVSSVQYAHAWAKAGVMIRATAHAAAAHGFALVTPGNGVHLQRRPSEGYVSISTGGATGTAPIWLKVERRGSTINAYRSATGSAWTLISSQAVTLPTSYLIGLAVTSHSAATLATAIFDNVTVRATTAAPTPQPPSVALTAPTAGATFTAPASVALAATAADTDGTVARVDFYSGSTRLGSDTSAPYAYTWNNVPAGSHTLTAVAHDDAGASTVSAGRTVIVASESHPTRAIFTPSATHDATYYYVLQIFHIGDNPSTVPPVATQDLGKPTIVDGRCVAAIDATIAALPTGSYIATVSAVGRDGQVTSLPSPQFVR